MTRKFCLIFAFLLALGQSAFSQDSKWFARIVSGKSPFFFNGKEKKVGDFLYRSGTLKTGKGAEARILFKRGNAVLLVGADTELQLPWSNHKKPMVYDFKKGKCRWIIPKKAPKKWIKVKTKSATMGVRGTDFLTFFRPESKETEIVVFDGKVKFQNEYDSSDHEEIQTGQWGGVGGKFGKKITPIKNLSKKELQSLRLILKNSAQ